MERLIAGDPALRNPVVLALPRGGAPVAFEVARRLNAPLDLVLVRKIGIPGHPELAAAAVVDGDEPQMVQNRRVIATAGLTRADLEAGKRKGLAEIARRRERCFAGRARVPVRGRSVIVVDDGVATGATGLAAVRGLRLQHPPTLVLAVPVAARDTLDRLRGEVDRVVCLRVPDNFMAVGAHYAQFDQTQDAEVVRLLDAAKDFGNG